MHSLKVNIIIKITGWFYNMFSNRHTHILMQKHVYHKILQWGVLFLQPQNVTQICNKCLLQYCDHSTLLFASDLYLARKFLYRIYSYHALWKKMLWMLNPVLLPQHLHRPLSLWFVLSKNDIENKLCHPQSSWTSILKIVWTFTECATLRLY